jgi:hypothetical protein
MKPPAPTSAPPNTFPTRSASIEGFLNAREITDNGVVLGVGDVGRAAVGGDRQPDRVVAGVDSRRDGVRDGVDHRQRVVVQLGDVGARAARAHCHRERRVADVDVGDDGVAVGVDHRHRVVEAVGDVDGVAAGGDRQPGREVAHMNGVYNAKHDHPFGRIDACGSSTGAGGITDPNNLSRVSPGKRPSVSVFSETDPRLTGCRRPVLPTPRPRFPLRR